MPFEIVKMSIFGNSNIGVYIYGNDKITFVPQGLQKKDLDGISQILQTDIMETSLANTKLLGVLMAGNNNGIILSRSALDDEVDIIKKSIKDLNLYVLPSRNNAVGNLIVANDKAALVYPYFEDDVIKQIQDTLGVEVFRRSIVGIPTVGAIIAVTNVGGLVHPDVTDEEIKFLEDIFKVPFKTGTVNFGVSFIKTGLIVNTKGAIVGEDTTGPEIARIQMVFSA
ncbi:translation initiation factor eIF-6, putative [Caldisphaera lagunensis DSM 15908]|uniref:Translation initiation factor 6 n=1 Tax=Caldisphaera lagunensis (strain DSM 15908 / JCM 11604 / ANMR 0165 / IC-154) TaxID=1056495 RepID=L0A8L8_CALLD|nr:translation initiation factor IF-6 [Caldisphaera lagunensis]AFZ70176.1 translation initiation factor eIF-6, putative [Caldisphaera lagunensis DSM 15908]